MTSRELVRAAAVAGLAALVLSIAPSCKGKKSGLAEPLPPPPPPEAKVEVLMIPSKVDAVDFRILFTTGSVDDPAGKEGLTALTAQLMAEGGTKSFSYPELLDRFYPMATEVGVQVDKQMTVFGARVHRDHLEAFIPLLAEVVAAPRFDAKDFERLRTDSLNGIRKGLRLEDDEQLSIQALDVWLHEGHPYGHLVDGTVKGLESITLDDVKSHYAKVFTRDRLVVGMAGAVDEELAGKLREAFRALPEKGAPKVEIPAPKKVDGIRIRIIEKDTDSTAIAFGYPIDVGRAHPDYAALWIAQSALGEHRQSTGRLFQTLREKRGLNYGDYAYIEPFVDHGETTKPTQNIARTHHAFSVWIRPVQNKDRLFALRLALWAIDDLVKNGFSADEVDRTKGFLEGYTRVFEESLDRRLGYALDDLFYGAEEPFLEISRSAFSSLTAQKVNEAVKAHVRTTGLMIVIVTDDAQTLKKQIETVEAAKVVYDTPKPPEVLEQDKAIVGFDAGLSKATIDVVKVEEVFEK